MSRGEFGGETVADAVPLAPRPLAPATRPAERMKGQFDWPVIDQPRLPFAGFRIVGPRPKARFHVIGNRRRADAMNQPNDGWHQKSFRPIIN